MNLREAYEYGTEKLQESGIANAKQESFYLLEFVTGVSRGKYYIIEQKQMSKEEQIKYVSLIDKRSMRIPLQHLIGTTEFMGLPFMVNPHVLIPRQDTELLVETALEIIGNAGVGKEGKWGNSRRVELEKDYAFSRTSSERNCECPLHCSEKKNSELEELRILDMCTGSGCILISTLYYAGKDYPKIVGVGVDISKEALEVSKENAIRNGFNVTKVESLKDLVYNKCIDKDNNESQIILIESNLFAKLDAMKEDIIAKRNEIIVKYNVILSNPPYIPASQISSLEEEVKCHDPILALDGGEDGLYFYRNIVEKSREYLVNEGVLILECGWNQGEAVSEIMKKQGYNDVKIIKDLSGLDRVVLGSNKE